MSDKSNAQKGPLEDEIRRRCADLAEFLVVKNRAYGNSAGDPIRVFAKPILSWMLFAETTPVEEFFALPREERACLSRVADTFDPASELAAAHDDLRAMLESGRPIFAGSAAMAIGVHAAHDPARTEPLVRRLWEETGPGGRLWLLTDEGQAVLRRFGFT